MAEKTDERLAKLFRLLASDKDGEVLAAVRAIQRVLKVTGKDWNYVSEAMETFDTIHRKSQRPESDPWCVKPEPQKPYARSHFYTQPSDSVERYRQMAGSLADLAEDEFNGMTQKQRDFVLQMNARFEKGGDVYLTDKQLQYLSDLYDRHC